MKSKSINLKYKLILLLVYFVLSKLNAQKINVQWQKTIGGLKSERLNDVVTTKDGGFIVSGWSTSNDLDVPSNKGGVDFWITKFNKKKEIQWSKSYGGTQNDFANTITQTKDGGYFVVGWTSSNDGDISFNHGMADGWALKLDKKGNILWEKTFGSSSDDGIFSWRGIKTNTNEYIIVGNSYEINGRLTSTGLRIAKLNNRGVVLWEKFIEDSEIVVSNIYWTNANKLFILGKTDSDNTRGDGFVMCLSKDGHIEWNKKFDNSFDGKINSIAYSGNSEYIAVGWSQQTINNQNNYWAIKFNIDGNILWEKTYGGTEEDIASSIVSTIDNNYVITGWTKSNNGDIKRVSNNWPKFNPWIIIINKDGDIQDQKIIGGIETDYIMSISKINNSEFLLVGETSSNNDDIKNLGETDGYIVKINILNKE